MRSVGSVPAYRADPEKVIRYGPHQRHCEED